MGFWGTYVVARAEPTLLGVQALMECSDALDREWRHGPWRVGVSDSGELGGGDLELHRALAEETGAPALTASVLDSDAVIVQAFGQRTGFWRACLVRDSMRGYSEQVDEDFDTAFLTPSAATERAMAWAQEAGFAPDATALRELFNDMRDQLFAENLLPELFEALGLPMAGSAVPMSGISPPLPGDAPMRRNDLDTFLLREAAPVLAAAGFTRSGRTYRREQHGDILMVTFRHQDSGDEAKVAFWAHAGLIPAAWRDWCRYRDTDDDADWPEDLQLQVPVEAPEELVIPCHSPDAWSVLPAVHGQDGSGPLSRRLREDTIPFLLELSDLTRRRDVLAGFEPPPGATLSKRNQVFLLLDGGPSKGLAAALSAAEQDPWMAAKEEVAWAENRLRDRFGTGPDWREHVGPVG